MLSYWHKGEKFDLEESTIMQYSEHPDVVGSFDNVRLRFNGKRNHWLVHGQGRLGCHSAMVITHTQAHRWLERFYASIGQTTPPPNCS